MKQTINPVGKKVNILDKVIDNKKLMLVHPQLESGEQVPSYDHKGQEVYFTTVKGTVEVTLNDIEVHHISTGAILHFPDEAHAGVNATESSDFSVYPISRQQRYEYGEHLLHVDLEKLGEIPEIKEAQQRKDISLEKGRTQMREQVGKIYPYEITLAERKLRTIEENERKREDIQKMIELFDEMMDTSRPNFLLNHPIMCYYKENDEIRYLMLSIEGLIQYPIIKGRRLELCDQIAALRIHLLTVFLLLLWGLSELECL